MAASHDMLGKEVMILRQQLYIIHNTGREMMIHKKWTTYIAGGKEQTHKRNQRGK